MNQGHRNCGRAWVVAVAAAMAVAAAGCKRADPRGDGARITGKPSDPAVTFAPRWDETNAFVYHLETITGTQVPRRNSEVVIQQDTVLAKDLRLGVTNITPQGVRALSIEIQAVRVETTSDQRLTSAFDTENEMLSTEDNTIASRLRRVKGAKLGFKLSPAGRVIRVDGMKEFNDRIGSNRNVRGAAGAVLNKFFNQQFYRDLVEMSFLPTNPVRVGDSWTVPLRSGAGLFNNTVVDVTYTFRGWQVHEGTNCARFDFVGGTQAGGTSTRRTASSASSSTEGAELEGTVWFSPDLGVPVEMEYTQSITRQTTSTRINRPGGTNGGPVVVKTRTSTPRGGTSTTNVQITTSVQPTTFLDLDEEPEITLPATNAPGRPNATANIANANTGTTTTNRTSTTKQQVTLTLIELVPVDPPQSRPALATTPADPAPLTTPVASPTP